MKWVNRVPFEFVYTRVTTPSFPAMELASRTFTGRLVTNPLMDFWNHQWKDLNSVITLWARIFVEMDPTASFESWWIFIHRCGALLLLNESCFLIANQPHFLRIESGSRLSIIIVWLGDRWPLVLNGSNDSRQLKFSRQVFFLRPLSSSNNHLNLCQLLSEIVQIPFDTEVDWIMYCMQERLVWFTCEFFEAFRYFFYHFLVMICICSGRQTFFNFFLIYGFLLAFIFASNWSLKE